MAYMYCGLGKGGAGLIFLWAYLGPNWIAKMDLLKRKQNFISVCRKSIDFSEMHNDVCHVPEGKIKFIRFYSYI